MGKNTGFLEINRKTANKREPAKRVSDWNEFIELPQEKSVTEQAARCMNCGTPFCHTGVVLEGSASGCPVHNKIPDFNDLVYRNRWKEALENLLETNNFPEFTGRVCPAPCEGSCVLGINQPPVTIKEIEHSIIERGFSEGWIKPNPPKERTGYKIAIIGSGPAGLAAADQLNKKGHSVTIFEKSDRAGGLLLYGIPNMKLDKDIVKRRIDLMEAEGIEFKLNTGIGENYSQNKVLKEYDSIILCCGAGRPRDLKIKGRNLAGIHFAMDYLTHSTKKVMGTIHELDQKLDAKDKNVVVLGGGDTGTDCIATAIRQGCKKVTQLEILPKPPEERGDKNPWPEWPKQYNLEYGQQEAKALFGKDPRLFNTKSLEFEGTEDGHIKNIHSKEIQWINAGPGRWESIEINGTEQSIAADMVLLALGYTGPEPDILDAFNINLQGPESGKPEEKYKTDVEGVFTAGDMRRGQSLVVWAIQEGREAAEACHSYLTAKKG